MTNTSDGLKRLVEWTRGLGKCAPQSSGEAQRVITVILRKAEQILAEEEQKAVEAVSSKGDEGLLNEDSVRGAIANILDMNDDVAQHMDITIKGEPTVLVSYLKDLISRYRPAPDRPEITCPACDFSGEAIRVCPSCGMGADGKPYYHGPSRTAELVKVIRLFMKAYPHEFPSECFATGPLTGDPIEDLVVCPGCRAKKAAEEILADFEEGV